MILQSMKKVAAAGLVSALLFPLAASAETKILFNIFTPPSHFTWDVYRDWAEQVHEASEGRLKVEFPAKSVAPPPKVLGAIRKGAADAGWVANIFVAKKNPGALIGLMPWMTDGDAEIASVAMWNTYQKFFAEKEKWPGVKVLGMYHFAGASMCSLTDEPIKSIEDLKKRKVWSLPGNLAKMLKNMDVSAVTGPAVQIHEMVSRNVVEAFTGISDDSIVKFKVAPYTKSCVDFPKSPFSITFTHAINAKVWAKLSPEDQKVLTDLSGEHLARMVGKRVNEEFIKARATLSPTVEFIPASDELMASLDEHLKPVVDGWIKRVGKMDVDGQAAMDFMRSEIARLSAK